MDSGADDEEEEEEERWIFPSYQNQKQHHGVIQTCGPLNKHSDHNNLKKFSVCFSWAGLRLQSSFEFMDVVSGRAHPQGVTLIWEPGLNLPPPAGL